MTPDFEYFGRVQLIQQHGHTLWGLLYFDVPLGLLLAYLYHGVARNALIDNLPPFLQSRLAPFKALNWHAFFKSRVWVVLASLLVGASSHLFWDAFTHEWGFFVERIPLLQTTITLGDWTLPTAKVLQHGSTAVGILLVGWGILRLPKTDLTPTERWRDYWWVVAGSLALVVGIRIIGGLTFSNFGNVVVAVISGGLWGLLLGALATRVRAK